MKHNKILTISFAFTTMLAIAPLTYASGDHGNSGATQHEEANATRKMPMDSTATPAKASFREQKQIDGYNVTIQVMKAEPGKEMGGTHDFMIKVEQDGKMLSDVAINTKVVHPNGNAETKATMKMGDWYMAGYDLGHAGKHQLMIQFKTADGVKHQGGVYFSGS